MVHELNNHSSISADFERFLLKGTIIKFRLSGNRVKFDALNKIQVRNVPGKKSNFVQSG